MLRLPVGCASEDRRSARSGRCASSGSRDRYGVVFGSVSTLDAGGAVTRQALRSGDVDVALMFTTDPAIAQFTELVDDRGLQPAENVTPLVRQEVIERFGPSPVEAMDAVSAALDGPELRASMPPTPASPAAWMSPPSPPPGSMRGGWCDDRPTAAVRRPQDRSPSCRPDRASSSAPSDRRPPPLPRSIGTSGRGWLVALLALVVWSIVTYWSSWARRATDQVDAAILRAIALLRTDWATSVFRAVDRAATGWTMSVAALVLLLSMIVFRRWRHLFTFLGTVVLLVLIGGLLIDAYTRPRPYDVTTIGRWEGSSLPSATVAVVGFTVVGFLYALVVPGRPRNIGKAIGLRGPRAGVRRAPVPGRRPPLRRRGRDRAGRRRSRSSHSGTSHRTSSFPVVVPAAARPPTSMWAGGGARRSDGPSQDQLGLDDRRGQAGRARRVRRVDAAPTPRGRRSADTTSSGSSTR